VLFENGKVSGIVDFGAMQPDNPAGDVARLLGSMAGNNRTLWAEGLAAFTEIRPLFPVERLLVRTYDESGVLLSGIHWLRWVFMERREFENANGVLARFDAILERLRDGFAQNESFPV
jgi:hypothetical protein